MTAEFYNFNKRRNSTAIPTGTGVKVTVNLKNETDFDNPVFILAGNYTSYNYVKWNGSYYYVVGHRYIRTGIYEVSCTIDSLATERSNIMSSTQYCLRSSVSPDYDLIDNFYPSKMKPTITQANASSSAFQLDDVGSIVLITISGMGVQYWSMTSIKFMTVLNTIMSTPQESLWGDIADAAQNAIPTLLKATDYIVGAKWIPFPVQSGSSAEIKLGYWGTGITANLVPENKITGIDTGATFGILWESTDQKKFLNCSSYRSVTVYVPGCGDIPIDYAKINGNNITVSVNGDLLGKIQCAIKNADGEVIARTNGIVGCDIPVSSTNINLGSVSQVISGAVSTIAGAIGGDPSAIGFGLGSIGHGAQSAIPDVQTRGGVGAYVNPPNGKYIMCTEVHYDITEQNGAINGYPCMKTLTLSTAGYYQVRNPQVDFAGDLKIKEEIIQYMSSGFYVE